MAAKNKPKRRCLVCGKTDRVMVYTIDNVQQVGVMFLCKRDAQPLTELMDAAGNLPPLEQVPLPDRERVHAPVEPFVHKRGRRMPEMVPLVWTPPPGPPVIRKPKPEFTDLDLIVIQFREEGMSWEGVGDALDISRQAAYERFKHLPVRKPGDPT